MSEGKRYTASTPGRLGAATAPAGVPSSKRSEILTREAEVLTSSVAPAGSSGSGLCVPLVEEIAREMQVPLSNMLLGAQTMEKLLAEAGIQGNSSGLVRVFRIFQRACQQQRHLVETLLELAQTGGERVLATEPIALETWLPEVLAADRERARLWQQEIQISIEPTLPPLATNGTILARVLMELFAEVSVRAPLGSTVALSVAAENDAFCFTWKSVDAATTDPAALEALQYLQERERPSRDGTGLSLARKLAHLLGGAIDPIQAAETSAYCLKLPLPLEI